MTHVNLSGVKLTDLVGNTPMVELHAGVDHPGVRLLGKLEGTNPGGSVKDRAARSMIMRAEQRGDLRPGVRLIEPTSGNTGIALAMIAASRGYPITLVMPENSTEERIRTMRAFGAEVILTPVAGGMEAAIDLAREKVASGGYLMLDQFANPDNWRAHYEGTAVEIFRDTGGEVTHFVSAMGTTGTIMGVSRGLKEKNPAIQIVGCQPTDGSHIAGIRRWAPPYVPAIFEPGRVDRIIDVSQDDAEQTARSLASTEGIFCGPSSGGAVWAARSLARTLTAAVIVCIICDRGDRYVSSHVFI